MLGGVVERYFPYLDEMEGHIEAIEEEILRGISTRVQEEIFRVRRQLISLRRFIAPQREIINTVLFEPSPLISVDNKAYFRDLHDDLLLIMDTLEIQRDLLSGAMEGYMSQVSNRLNEIMKVLSIVATIILPLTLLSGIYGMNFDWMPGLHHPLGFWFLLGAMLLMVILSVAFFKRKGWF